MNWLSRLMQSLSVLPVLVAGIEKIHGEAPGATKKQMAIDALNLASGVASIALPGETLAIQAATELAGNVIDGLVKTFNATGLFQHGSPTSAPAPAPAAVSPSTQIQVHQQ